MKFWNAVLLIYRQIDVRYPGRGRLARHFTHELTPLEVEEAEDSFRHFPTLVQEFTDGRVSVVHAIVRLQRPLRTVSPITWGGFWPGPKDVKAELDQHAPRGAIDSVFVLWPQTNFVTGQAIPSGGWGFGMGATEETNGATYAAIANAPEEAWRKPRVGEVWLHEWLHGVCHHFAQSGHIMPEGDADGGGRHGYVQSPVSGWTDYYRDLMNGQVSEKGKLTGIASAAWFETKRAGTLPA